MSENAQETTQALVKKQCQITDKMQQSVTTDCSEFHQKVFVAHLQEIENRRNLFMKKSAAHKKATSDAVSTAQNLSRVVGVHMNAYANEVIHMNDPTPELEDTRTNISFSEKLSSTPSEQELFNNEQEQR